MIKSFIRKYCSRLVGNAIGPEMTELTPPARVRGMKVLDRSEFSTTWIIPVLKLNVTDIKPMVRCLKRYFLKLENFKPIHSTEADLFKSVYLNPNCVRSWCDFDPQTAAKLKQLGINGDHLHTKELIVTYENWKSDEIIKAVLPPDKETPTSYSLVGHIVHLNLREQHLEYKHIIGAVLLDKLKNCKTVVNKTNEINNTYRNFTMEVLCGEDNFVTCVKENGCRFDFDFSRVYWNTRLSTEHERIVALIQRGDVLFDVFAGVGPFAVPAAKKKCTVYANDLNPDSYEWLQRNTKANKVSKEYLKPFNVDGREFLCTQFAEFLIDIKARTINFNENNLIHVTMNLPALAVTFLDAFVGIVKESDVDVDSLQSRRILVHVYCFVHGDLSKEAVKDEAKTMVERSLGFGLDERSIHEVSFVRSVAPNKDMMRVSFYLATEVLLGNVSNKRKHTDSQEDEPTLKHQLI